MERTVPKAVVVGLCVSLAAGRAAAQTFDLIPTRGPESFTNATGVSADGRTVAGWAGGRGFTWTREGGRFNFGDEGGLPSLSVAYGLSPDGAAVVGSSRLGNGPRLAYAWSGLGTFHNLGALPGYTDSYALDASAGGTVIVGRGQDALGFAAGAFRWTQAGGMQDLGRLAGAIYTEARAVSADGSTVVGLSGGAQQTGGFVWTTSGGIRTLARLNGSNSWEANAVSSDGRWIAGQCAAGTAGLWHDEVVESLGLFGGFGTTRATGVSDDGSVAAGQVEYDRNHARGAGVWIRGSGWSLLSDYLAANGVDIPTGWSLYEVTGISADGRTFIGTANSAQGQGLAFVATAPTPGALPMLACGLAYAAGRRRRQRGPLPSRSAGPV